MNTSRIFWGTLLIVAGALILLSKLDFMTLEIGSFWRFWPLAIVIWGISLLTGARGVRSLLAVLAGILLALVVYEVWEEWGSGRESRQMTTQTFMETYDTSYHRASLRFISGAGTFTIRDTSDALLHAETTTNYGSYEISGVTGSEGKQVTLRLADRMSGFRLGGRNDVTMSLHPAPLWALNLEVGAAKLDADLSAYAADDVDIKTGAAEVRVKLGDRAEECRVRIHAGASSITVRVPEASGCEIRSETGLTSKTFRGFEEEGDGSYRTANFDGAPRKIFLTLKAGVSSLRVDRY